MRERVEEAAVAAEETVRRLELEAGRGGVGVEEAWRVEERAAEAVDTVLEGAGVPMRLLEYARMHVVAEATLILLAEGLEPTIGFLHPDHVPPSLSRDLSLEFIHQTADVAVLQSPECSRRGVLLSLERRMEEKFTHPRLGVEATYRETMRRQVKTLAAYFAGRAPGYQPYEEPV